MHRRSFLLNTASGLGSPVALGMYPRADGSELKEAPATGGHLKFTTGFEGGSLGKVVRVTDTYTRCILDGEVDQDGRNRQVSWFYFHIEGSRDSEQTIEFTDLEGEYNYRPGNWSITPDTLPVYSYDGHHWSHAAKNDWMAAASSMQLRIRPAGTEVWLAHVPPYTTRSLARLLDSIKGEHEVEYE